MDAVRTVAAVRRRGSRPRTPTGTRKTAIRPSIAPLVLIVDDSDDVRDLYTEAFVHSGLRVTTAIDGDHALLKAASIVPDLVVMDLAMPVLDGWDATRFLKSHPKTRHIPVVVLTGLATPDALKRAHEAGANAVLTKPCSPDALIAVVQTWLGR
jgi:two-component system cell cycle response regulator DivK